MKAKKHFRSRALLIFIVCLGVYLINPIQANEKPATTLASTYNIDKNINFSDYWVSEKLDGVRGIWTGKVMLTRQGNTIHLPKAIKKQLPDVALDGEIWIARNTFDKASALVRRKTTTTGEWFNEKYTVSYNVFDLPDHKGTFDQRLKALEGIYEQSQSTHIQNQSGNQFWRPVKQFKINSHKALIKQLHAIEALGGEGLMLHKGSSHYHNIRNDDLLKVKSFEDAEATVIAHLPGKGKYTNLLGAISVLTPEGYRFNIGSGFSDKERTNPPAIGSVITYKYYGTTHKGTPRFASFLRVHTTTPAKL